MRDPDNRKTAQRCAIATPFQEHKAELSINAGSIQR